MLITKNVDIKINKSNFNHYLQDFIDIKLGDIINIPVNKLSKGTHKNIQVKCDICGKEKYLSYTVYFKNINKTNIYCCSSKCSRTKVKQTNLERYGVENIFQLDVIKEKVKQSNLEKYGFEYAIQSNSIKEKVKKTNLKKYGVICTLHDNEIKEKVKKTNLERYGVENVSKSEKIKEKKKETNILNYGVINVFQSEIIKQKSKISCFERYGVEYAQQNKDIKEKTIQTNINKYGSYHTKNIDIKNKIKNTNNLKTISNNQNILEILNDEFICKCEKGHEYNISKNIHYVRKNTGIKLCTICNPIKSYSYAQNELYNYIKENYTGEILVENRKTIKPYELDIYLPELNLAFEYNGLWCHDERFRIKNYHKMKSDLCEEKGIQLIHIWGDDWSYKKDIIKSMILNKLNKNLNKIYARKCEIKKLDSKTSKDFLNNNHIQGFVGSPIRLGLYYNDELVSLMTFGKKRLFMKQKSSEEDVYELLRFCNKLNTSVIGGASRLFQYFIKNYNPKIINTYADRSYSNGNLYKQLGFTFIHKTEPNYYYVIDGIRKHRFGFRKDVLVKQGFDSNKTEHEIMLERKIYRIFNAGNQKFIYN